MTKYIFNVVMLEITRKCNLNCKHCMRGNAQNKDLNIDNIDKLLDCSASINNLFFSGGEPLMNTEGIFKVLDKVIEKNVKIGKISMVTNGLLITNEFLDKFEQYASKIAPKTLNETSIFISQDDYHEGIPDSVKEIMNNSKYIAYSDENKEKQIVGLGRAVTNNLDCTEYTPNENIIKYRQYGGDVQMLFNTFYITYDGNVQLSCDYEYGMESELSIGCLQDSCFKDIISNYLIDEFSNEFLTYSANSIKNYTGIMPQNSIARLVVKNYKFLKTSRLHATFSKSVSFLKSVSLKNRQLLGLTDVFTDDLIRTILSNFGSEVI